MTLVGIAIGLFLGGIVALLGQEYLWPIKGPTWVCWISAILIGIAGWVRR